MTEDELQELVDDCPWAYHMAERGAWEGVKKNGLLSTSALLDLYRVSGVDREEIEAARRDASVGVEAPGLPKAIIRDQLPMDDAGLRRCLPIEISPADWYRFLNRKVFFWLTEDRLWRLTGAKAYRNTEHEVLVVDTKKLIDSHRDRVWLCPMNSGCTKPMPHPRDYATFSRIDDYPYPHWRRRRKIGERVVELCIDDAVKDITKFVQEVYVIEGQRRVHTIL